MALSGDLMTTTCSARRNQKKVSALTLAAKQQKSCDMAGEEPDVVHWAQHYLNQGNQPVPLYPRSKRPIGDGWQNFRLKADGLPSAFSNGENIGILTGAPSGGLADVDKDCDEAIALARSYLPATGWVFGRENHITHELFGLEPTDFATLQFRDPTIGNNDLKSMLIELRGTGSQTMAPPSIHPKGGKPIK
jgi:hypothetical protein